VKRPRRNFPEPDFWPASWESLDNFRVVRRLGLGGVFTPVLAKHSKSFPLIDSILVGVDRMQRNFEPMRKQ
jgi:hypothetical protein